MYSHNLHCERDSESPELTLAFLAEFNYFALGRNSMPCKDFGHGKPRWDVPRSQPINR